jgi:phospholipid/cholesterol/gamma-HCH transport system substrate-binding protein
MNERTRNIAVGMTVMVALVMLGILILLFTGLPGFLKRGYSIQMRFDVTHDLDEGDSLYVSGIRSGVVTSIRFADENDPGKGVTFAARIDRGIRLPGNTKAVIFTKGLMGKGYLALVQEGPLPTDANGKAIAYLPTDGSAILQGEHRGNDLFPPELSDALKGLSLLTKNLNELVAPTPAAGGATTGPSTGPTTEPAGLQGTVAKFNRTLDALYAVLGDQQNQANIKSSLANLADAAAKTRDAMDAFKEFAQQASVSVKDVSKVADNTGQQIDTLARKLMDDADSISRLMNTLQETVEKMGQGQGTTGKLINDPQLYNNLVDATRKMNDLLAEFHDLVKTWRESGLEMKLK